MYSLSVFTCVTCVACILSLCFIVGIVLHVFSFCVSLCFLVFPCVACILFLCFLVGTVLHVFSFCVSLWELCCMYSLSVFPCVSLCCMYSLSVFPCGNCVACFFFLFSCVTFVAYLFSLSVSLC